MCMRREGLEPSRIDYPYELKSYAFANFAIPANFYHSFNGRVSPLFYHSFNGRVSPLFYHSFNGRVSPLFYYSFNGRVSPLTEGEGFEPSRVLSPNDLANRPLHRLSNLPGRPPDSVWASEIDWSMLMNKKHLPIWANKSEGDYPSFTR